jgi:predicted nucleic acid-binding protein
LIALSKIGLLAVLKDLFQEIIITQEVQEEFGEVLPDWIIISNAQNKILQSEIATNLDKGEASSIVLAMELKDSILIIDDIKGRKVVRSLKIEIIGTIGILLLAEKKGLIKDLMTQISLLVENGFWLSGDILEKLNKK